MASLIIALSFGTDMLYGAGLGAVTGIGAGLYNKRSNNKIIRRLPYIIPGSYAVIAVISLTQITSTEKRELVSSPKINLYALGIVVGSCAALATHLSFFGITRAGKFLYRRWKSNLIKDIK